MAHRIYLFNYDQDTSQTFDTYLGEWNYEIPLLLYPLIAENIQVQGVEFISNKNQGIAHLRYFFNLLADTYQLHYKMSYYEPVNKMFEFLEALPYDSFLINATDVFNMNEEKHKEQAKVWLLDIQQKNELYKMAVEKQDLTLLDPLFSQFGYASFLEILQTDWIDYGLGYFEEQAYKKVSSVTFDENGKFGLKDVKGTVLVAAIYDDIFEADHNYDISVIQKGNLFGYLQSNGKECVAPVYEEAADVFDFGIEPLGQVKVNGRWGVIKVYTNTWLVAPDYDTIERLTYGFFGVEKDCKFGVYNHESGLLIPTETDSPFDYDYFPELFFSKQEGTSKRKYYTKQGVFLGDFLEGSIIKASTCYWIKPNKFDQKGRLIDKKGDTIIAEADQLVFIENFEALAIRKAKEWKIYHSSKHRFLLEEEFIVKVKTESNTGNRSNTHILEIERGLGLFDTDKETWLVNPTIDIKQIHYLQDGFLSIQKNVGYQLFDFDQGLFLQQYDYISSPLNYRAEEGILFLYQGQDLFRMNEDRSIHRVATAEYGAIYLDRYSFRGKDLTYFVSFYNRWKNQAGTNAEQSMDVATIMKMAIEAKESEDYKEALRLFELAALKNDVDSWIELGLLHTDPAITTLFDPQQGIAYYEKAASQEHPVAWNNIGALYQNGIGHPFDIEKAIQAYEKAVQLGDGMALANLGDLHYFGEHIPQDYNRALDYYQKAEKKRYYHYDKISEIYYQLRDYSNLLVYLKKDYDQSYSGIYYGIIYEHGMGVKADLKKAIKYYEQANAYAAYEYATQRLLYYYGQDLTFKNENKFQKWKSFATANEFEIS